MRHANPFTSEPALLVVTRFRVTDREAFAKQARTALRVLAESPGFLEGAIGQSTDETNLLVITTRWENVGRYRKALSRYEVKVEVVPWLSTAVDESSAYELVHIRTAENVIDIPSGRAADADHANLGQSAAPHVPPVMT
jgi:quinol monooxygenase YgiN